MEMRPGFKQTEIGVFPAGWTIAPFGTLALIERGKFSARPRNDPRFYGGDIPFLQTGDVTRSGGVIDQYSQTLNAEGLRVSRLFPKGTLLFTIAANIGDVGITAFDAACPDSLVGVSPRYSIDKQWLFYELASRKADFENLASPGAQLNINLEKLQPYLLPVPSRDEQREIGEALSDVDALLAGLDRLIAKKRDLKQAAMQQLLTGQIRLPGFQGEWEVKRIADFATVGSGGTPSRVTAAYWGGSIPWITTSQINFGTIGEAEQFITYEGLRNSAAKLLPAGTLLMALYGQGKTRGKVGILGFPATTNQACASIELNDSVSRDFILQCLTSRYEEIRDSSNSGSQENLSGSIVKAILVALPPLTEQCAISSVLGDMDAELTALEARRNKTRALKQAMMQELLTGRTRLV